MLKLFPYVFVFMFIEKNLWNQSGTVTELYDCEM